MKITKLLLLVTVILFSCSSNESSYASNPILEAPKIEEGFQQENEKGKKGKTSKVAGLELLCSTDNNFYYIDQPRENVYLYTELNAAYYNNTDKKRTPLNLSIVIDRSGSMSGAKLQNAKEAAIFAVKQLNASDYISIITYGSDVSEILAPTKVENTHFIINKIINIQDNGGTNLSGGMIKGFENVKENFDQEYLNRVFLLSDGLANEGIINIEELTKIVANWKEKENISLSTFGIGLGFNENLMTDISEYGGGNYYFINKPKDITSIFKKELNGLTSLVAKNISMKIEYPENLLKLENLYGYIYKDVPGTIQIDFSDMFSKEKKAVMLKFSIIDLKEETIKFSTKVKFTDVINDSPTQKEIALNSEIAPTRNQKVITENINNYTMQQAILFQSNFAMEKAAKELDEGKYDDARKTLKSNNTYISNGIGSYGSSEELINIQDVSISYELEADDFENKDKADQNLIQKSNKSSNYLIKKKK